MLLFAALLVTSSLSAFAFPDPNNASDLLSEAKKLYDLRAEGAVGLMAKTETIDKAIASLEKVYATGYKEEETGLYLIRCYNYKGRFACASASAKKSTFEKGKNLGEKLVKKYPNSVPLLYEYICVMGLWGGEIGALKAGWDGLIGKMKENTQRLIELDASYSGCAGERIMGYLYIKAPYIPLVLTWPDDDTGLEYLERVAKCSPYDFGTLYYYAEALHKNGFESKAKEYMKKITTMAPRKELYLEDLQFKKDAELLLKQWK
ncbi:MAG: hypothetical protein POELPBGB_02232 [Bacteroidia bacterium]|nr:hypothetical protein [Bacteroidia bacterium]